jgi:hypothetical protein
MGTDRTAFISHASEDAAVADDLCTHLEQAGIPCWVAPRDVTPGRDYASEIIDGIEACPVFVLLLSSAANQSAFVTRELERAASKGKRVFPVRIADVLPDRDMELFVSSAHWIDALQPPRAVQWERLARAIKGESSAPRVQASVVSGVSAASSSTGDGRSAGGRRTLLPIALGLAAGAVLGVATMFWRGGEGRSGGNGDPPPVSSARSGVGAAPAGAAPALAVTQTKLADAVAKVQRRAPAASRDDAASVDPCPQSLAVSPTLPTPYTCMCDSMPRRGGAVWGTDLYTADSDVCRAAVHAGVVAAGGGAVTVERLDGRGLYPGTLRHGVRSNDYGRYDASIHFVGTPMPPDPGPCPATLSLNTELATPFSCVCDSAAVADGAVWGSGPYTADSALCHAARHAGVVGAEGGTITAEFAAGRQIYAGTTRNGVASHDYGQYSTSVRFR